MSVFNEYEQKVVESLVTQYYGPNDLNSIVNESEFVSFEHTVVGYYLTVSHPVFPKERKVCDKPNLVGRLDDGEECGFVIFLMDSELTIECYSYDDSLPEDIRNMNVAIEIAT